MSKRGLVLSVKAQQVTVLCPNGEFREILWGPVMPQVGSEIVLPPVRRQAWWQVVAVAALLLSLGGVLWGAAAPLAAKPVSYVAVDINPSVEFYLDAEQEVLQVQGLNADGELVVRDDLQGLTLDEALPLVLEDAARNGFVGPDHSNLVLLAVVPLEWGQAPPPLEDMAQVMEIALGDEVEALVALQEASREDLEEAKKDGLSLNKYLLGKQRQLQGESISLTELRTSSVQEIIDRAGVTPQEILLEGFSTRQVREGTTWNRVRLVDRADKTLLVTGPSSITHNLGGEGKEGEAVSGENGERARTADNGAERPSATVPSASEKGKPAPARPPGPAPDGSEKAGETTDPEPGTPETPADDQGRSSGEIETPPQEEEPESSPPMAEGVPGRDRAGSEPPDGEERL